MSEPLSFAARASNLAKEQSMPRANQPKRPQQQQQPVTQPITQQINQSNGQSIARPLPSPAKPVTKPVAKPMTPAKPVDPILAAAASLGLPSTQGVKYVKAAKQGAALVKAVPSGDALIVQGNVTEAGQAAPEKTIVINNIIAPKFAKGRSQVDEPFAWESREYLRKKVIGQRVQFDISHSDEKSGREWGLVSIDGQDLALDIVQHGWAKVKTSVNKEGKERSGPDDLVAAQEEAKAAGRGLWLKNANEKHHIRTIDFQPDARAFFEANRGRPIPAVVDGVRDGSTLRVELLNGNAPLNHTVIFLNLSGVQCPRTPLPLSVLQQQHENKMKDGNSNAGAKPEQQEEAEPFAIEAQQYTELRLLNREVNVILQGVDKFGNFFGSIQFSKGNISLKLLELGFGKLVPWSAALTNEADRLKNAEAQAKQHRLRVWSLENADAESPSGTTSNQSAASWEGKVVSIVSGDTISVIDGEGVERRVSLASVRAPRAGRRGDKEEPFAAEAKEHLRSKLIGHRVKVIPEYTRTVGEEARQFATVFQGKVNINESLVGVGLAEVTRHRMNEERSQFYDTYLSAERDAEKSGRGKFNKKPQTQSKIVDLTDRPRRRPAAAVSAEADDEDEAEKKVDPKEEERASKAKALSAKAKTYLSFLSRDKNVSAVVEYVFTPSRYKLLVPKENIMISFALGGVRTPPAKTADGQDDPVYAQALQFVRSRIMQHTVRIEVEALDKGDNFLGSLFSGRINIGLELLREGLASLVEFSAKRSPYAKELFAAEADAKAAKKGIWLNWVPPVDEPKPAVDGDESAAPTIATDKMIPVKVTEIEDANDFWVHFLNDGAVDRVEAAMRDFGETVDDQEYHPSQSNAVCAGQFEDGNWYRVKLQGTTPSGDYQVFFLDYGNHDLLAADRLRALPAEIAKLPAVAHHATLSNIAAPKNEDYKEAAAQAFNDLVWGAELLAKVDHVDFNKIHHLTLTQPGEPFSVNKRLLRDGHAKVSTRPIPKLRDQISELREHEEFAKNNHYNIWEYGYFSDDDHEDEKPQFRGRK